MFTHVLLSAVAKVAYCRFEHYKTYRSVCMVGITVSTPCIANTHFDLHIPVQQFRFQQLSSHFRFCDGQICCWSAYTHWPKTLSGFKFICWLYLTWGWLALATRSDFATHLFQLLCQVWITMDFLLPPFSFISRILFFVSLTLSVCV